MPGKGLIIVGCIAALSVFLGCGHTPRGNRETLLDKKWGSSFEAAKSNQILNQDAEEDHEPVLGLDGKAVNRSLEKYYESFEEAAPKPQELRIPLFKK